MNTWIQVVGPILALVSAVSVAVILGRRGKASDKIAAQAGIATDKTNSIGQVMAALNSLNDNLQRDNEVLRDADREREAQIAKVRVEVAELRRRLDDVESGSLALTRKNLELERENRILHAENEVFKVQIGEHHAESEALKLQIGELTAQIAAMQLTIDELRR